MEALQESYKKDKFLHHAYLIGGDRAFVLPVLRRFLEKDLGIKTQGNPDVVMQEFETFTIDDARNLKELASRKAFGGGKKIFIVASNFFTREAQNSLLKLFEEPTPDTHFFIITSNSETILPTLRSRLMKTALEGEREDSDLANYAKEFLKLSSYARLEASYIKTMIEDKDKQKALIFLDYLTKALRERVGGDIASYAEVFNQMISSRNYIRDRSASVKLILEHISLVIPKF